MWDEEDRKRRLRRELGGGEDPVFGSYDASGSYVGLTPLQGPSWFTSTLFSNASYYSVDRTREVVDRFLRTTGLAEQERDNETSLGTEAVGETEHAKAKKNLARLALQGEPDLRLASVVEVAPEATRAYSDGPPVLMLAPISDGPYRLERPSLMTSGRGRGAGDGASNERADERARTEQEQLAEAEALQQGEYQERLEQRLESVLKKLGMLTLAPGSAPPDASPAPRELEASEDSLDPQRAERHAAARQMWLDRLLGIELSPTATKTMAPLIPESALRPQGPRLSQGSLPGGYTLVGGTSYATVTMLGEHWGERTLLLRNPVLSDDPDGKEPVETDPQKRFRQVFDQTGGNAALTITKVFGDSTFSDAPSRGLFLKPTDAQRRLGAILEITRTDPDSSTHFNWVVSGTGDKGFRRELMDSVQYLSKKGLHPQSSNQIGHFLTAAGFGLNVGMVKRDSDGVIKFRERFFARLMVGHELVADDVFMAHLRQTWAPTSEQIDAFIAGKLDAISIDATQRGNSYQDLYLSKIGYVLGFKVGRKELKTRGDVEEWLQMALVDPAHGGVDLASIGPEHKFYKDARWLKGLFEQFKGTQRLDESNAPIPDKSLRP